MKAMKHIFPVMLLAVLSGCTMVSNEEWGKLNQDIADLKRDSQDSAKAREAMKLQIQEMEKTTAAELSSRISVTEKALSDAEKDLRGKQADTVADITSIRSDFQVLTGRFEEARYAMERAAKEGKVSLEDVNAMHKESLQKIEELNKRISSIEQALALMHQEKEQKAAEVPSFEDAYKDAYETYTRKDYPAAREKFEKYIETYPNTKYQENAHFWIGETYFNEKNYERAIVVFDDVVKKYPEGTKAPAALLKQGMAFSALGDTKSAKAIYKKLIASHPKSEQADVARKRLKE